MQLLQCSLECSNILHKNAGAWVTKDRQFYKPLVFPFSLWQLHILIVGKLRPLRIAPHRGVCLLHEEWLLVKQGVAGGAGLAAQFGEFLYKSSSIKVRIFVANQEFEVDSFCVSVRQEAVKAQFFQSLT